MVLFYHYQLSIIDPIFLESRKCSRESLFVSYEHYISADCPILRISYLSMRDSFDRCFLFVIQFAYCCCRCFSVHFMIRLRSRLYYTEQLFVPTRKSLSGPIGSLYVSGKLPTYPSPKPTLTLTSHLGQNVCSGERQVGWAVSQKANSSRTELEQVV